ncbi:MAG: hypothetical protein ACYS7M_04270, partial [Planctomycetota bacterium]
MTSLFGSRFGPGGRGIWTITVLCAGLFVWGAAATPSAAAEQPPPKQEKEDAQDQESSEKGSTKAQEKDDQDQDAAKKEAKDADGAAEKKASKRKTSPLSKPDPRTRSIRDFARKLEQERRERATTSRPAPKPPVGGQPDTPESPTPATQPSEEDNELDPDEEARLLEELANLPAEDRTYQFAFEDIEYADLLDAFSRMSGLAIMGDPPSGKVTFKTTEVMDFKTAYNRIRLLLFKHRDNCWMVRDGKVLEVTRMTEIPRIIPFSDIFPNVAAFEAAERDDNDLVMLLYAP